MRSYVVQIGAKTQADARVALSGAFILTCNKDTKLIYENYRCLSKFTEVIVARQAALWVHYLNSYSFFNDVMTKMIYDERKHVTVGIDSNDPKAVYRHIHHNLAEQIMLDPEDNKWGNIKNETLVNNMYKEPSSSTKSSLIEYCTKLMPNNVSPMNGPCIVDTNMSATNSSSNLLPDKAIQFYTSLLEVNMNERMTKITQDAAHKNTSNEFENYGFFHFIIDIKLKLIHIKKAFFDQFSHGFEEPDATRQFTETERSSFNPKAVYRHMRHNLTEQIMLDPEDNKWGNIKNKTLVNDMYKEPSSSTKSSLIEYCTKLMPNKASPTDDPHIVDTNMSATNSSSNLLPDKAIQFYTSLLEVNMNDRMTKITQDAAHKNTSNEFENYGFFHFIIDIKLKLIHIKKAFFDQFSHGFEEPDVTRQFTETERSNFNPKAVYRHMRHNLAEQIILDPEDNK